MFGAFTPSLPSFSALSGSSPGTGTPPPKQAPRKSAPSIHAPSVNHLSRAAISLEYTSLRYQSHCPLGMYIIPFADDPSIWDAVLFIHQGEPYRSLPVSLLKAKVTWRQGYYTDSILKFRLIFPHNYPEQPPTVHFVTDVFHPLISHQDGTFNLAPKFNPWRSVPLPRQVCF